MARRDDILNAIYEADRLHKQHDTEARATRGESRIDVFGMLIDRNIPVIFRPLKNLLGVYINDPDQGVMVTTQRRCRFNGSRRRMNSDMLVWGTRPVWMRKKFSHGRSLLPKRATILGKFRPTLSRRNCSLRLG